MNCILQYLTHEFLSVFVPYCSNFIGRGHLPLATPGIQKIFNVTHDLGVFCRPKKTKRKKIKVTKLGNKQYLELLKT
jgi:hypothetical protein